MAKDKRQMMVKVGDSTFDKIQAFYINPGVFELSPSVEEIRLRWVWVTNLLLKGFPKYKIANTLVQDHGLSQAQAYIDIRNSESLFGDIYKTSKEVEKAMWKEWVRDYLKRAKLNKDLKAEGKALDLFAKYGDFTEEDLLFNPEKLENKEIAVSLDPKLLKFLQNMVSGGVADFNDLDVTDIDYEDATE